MEQAEQIIEGLGGANNIVEIEPCITRLRADIKDPDKVNEDLLTKAGAFGIVKTGHAIQVVVGPIADNLAIDIEQLL